MVGGGGEGGVKGVSVSSEDEFDPTLASWWPIMLRSTTSLRIIRLGPSVAV